VKLAPPGVEEKAIVAVVELVRLGGAESMDVSGGPDVVVSTVHTA
jgi:hypothetical protein